MLHNFLSFDDNADNTYSKVHSNLSFYCHVFIKPIPTNEKTIFHCHFLLLLTNCEISRRQQSCIIKVWKEELCRQRFKFLAAGDNFFCFRRNFSPLRRRSVVCEPEGGSMISHAEQRKYLPRGACVLKWNYEYNYNYIVQNKTIKTVDFWKSFECRYELGLAINQSFCGCLTFK